MKTLVASLGVLGLLCLFAACGGKGEGTQQAQASMADSLAMEAEAMTPIAICLWEKVGLRDSPGTGGKYLATIYFGEKVELVGASREVDDKTYLKMRLSDGEEGWANAYLFAEEAELAVAAEEVELYRRPDVMTAMGEKIPRGEIVAVKQGDNPQWVEVVSQRRKLEGWIQKGINISTEEVDLTVAVLLEKALQEEDPAKRTEALEAIADNSAYQSSIFIDLVAKNLSEEAQKVNLSDNELVIIGEEVTVRSLPSLSESEVVFTVNEGVVCEIMRRTNERLAVGAEEDYWYRIRHEGREGWVFGAYTSRKSAD